MRPRRSTNVQGSVGRVACKRRPATPSRPRRLLQTQVRLKSPRGPLNSAARTGNPPLGLQVLFAALRRADDEHPVSADEVYDHASSIAQEFQQGSPAAELLTELTEARTTLFGHLEGTDALDPTVTLSTGFYVGVATGWLLTRAIATGADVRA